MIEARLLMMLSTDMLEEKIKEYKEPRAVFMIRESDILSAMPSLWISVLAFFSCVTYIP